MSEMPPSPFAPPRTENFTAVEGPGGEVPHTAIEALRKTRPWVIFLSILSFLGAGLLLVMGVFVGLLGSMGSIPDTPGMPRGVMGAIGIFYFLAGGLYIYPGVRLLQYGLSIGRLVQDRQPASLTRALELQMRFWRFMGIATIAGMALYFVGIVVFAVLAASGVLKP
ncbi:MAG TPA: DUF5362 family protein [Candidatus Polarisedimenticolaceae bacterium]